jgi:hypothetical protein
MVIVSMTSSAVTWDLAAIERVRLEQERIRFAAIDQALI